MTSSCCSRLYTHVLSSHNLKSLQSTSVVVIQILIESLLTVWRNMPFTLLFVFFVLWFVAARQHASRKQCFQFEIDKFLDVMVSNKSFQGKNIVYIFWKIPSQPHLAELFHTDSTLILPDNNLLNFPTLLQFITSHPFVTLTSMSSTITRNRWYYTDCRSLSAESVDTLKQPQNGAAFCSRHCCMHLLEMM